MAENMTRLFIIGATLLDSIASGQHRAWIDEVWEALRDWRRELGVS